MTSGSQSTHKPSTAVIEQVAEVNSVKPVELPSLYRAIDPDALDALFHDRSNGCVEFRYADCWVTVFLAESEVTVETIQIEK